MAVCAQAFFTTDDKYNRDPLTPSIKNSVGVGITVLLLVVVVAVLFYGFFTNSTVRQWCEVNGCL